MVPPGCKDCWLPLKIRLKFSETQNLRSEQNSLLNNIKQTCWHHNLGKVGQMVPPGCKDCWLLSGSQSSIGMGNKAQGSQSRRPQRQSLGCKVISPGSKVGGFLCWSYSSVRVGH